tara:strand:+ start:2202 stop:2465 length:264 start_codon:yes stop_codon:yes gene_type:complete
MSKEIKTFTSDSMVSFEDCYHNRINIDMQGIRYTTTENFWCKILKEDMPKLKALLGDKLYEFVLENNGFDEDGATIEIPEDEVWSAL